MNHVFFKPMIPKEYQSIDKGIIKFKCPNIMKQYLKQKPIKWGFKMWVRASLISRYVYEVDLYTRKKPNVVKGLGKWFSTSQNHFVKVTVVLQSTIFLCQ